MTTETTTEIDFDTLPMTITFCGKIEDKKWPHFLWSVAIKKLDGGVYVTSFKTGMGWVVLRKGARIDPTLNKRCIAYERQYNAAMIPKKPTNKDVLYSLLMDMGAAVESFSDWCSNFGWSDDSIKAFGIYQECCKVAVEMNQCFTREQISEMNVALEDY